MMLKKNFYVEFSECILCDTNILESIVHLFFECSFSQSFWWALGFEWNTDLDINSMITDAKNQIYNAHPHGDYNYMMLELMGSEK
jgi:hypothetical protein